ncbi:Alpha-amylase/alpha-mannosidase, GH57 family [Mariprofundus aestuarium]|uniref:Alpha-amylase/alpha-mannosidase, GH57 family n=1 Tax=Mariprofundus aestuarium TaxID=1921086 RepID=A0A2K8KWY4_MARES|nr:glycoside hydrolase family 57 protein [Mariprofundus aestuarium]ATX79407.1 Alpha-amylase/alpha-mannosidase, GH57 family [Mariprofundus aestuarium]
MSKPLSVIFYWHMHQPFYCEADTGNYHLPWVYLHAMKDYTDMAEILSQLPRAKAVINYVPSLTAQIEDYAAHLREFLNGDTKTLNDPLLAALAHKSGEYSKSEREYLLEACFRLNHERNMHRYPAYSRLWNLAEHAKGHEGLNYLGDSFFSDLVTWYHLAWLGETVRSRNFVARRLIEKARDFSYQDRRDLLTLITTLLSDIPATHRRLVEAGKIELTTTPYAHPIIPLMLDFNTARETVQDALIPNEPYPGGRERALDHIDLARQSHEKLFGHTPSGCWPAEGAVSEETLKLLGGSGFQWCATGEAVLHHSLKYNLREQQGNRDLYHPWLVGEGEEEITCFFRDDHLSDLLGFEYSRWNMQDAINNFMHELALIRHRTKGMDAPVVSIIMDGENAWEHYHENALPFLTNLYQSIIEHDEYELTTFSEYLGQSKATEKLDHLVPGSWVYGNLSTWIGDHAKTRGWELLIEAKKAYDIHIGELTPAQQEEANEQLRICEGSDWCWWFGDYNPGAVVRDFDQLYRRHLRKLHQLLGSPVPPSLQETISTGGGDAEGGGTMRRGGADS